MIRHELKDGCWYLIKCINSNYTFTRYSEEDGRFVDADGDYLSRYDIDDEWVEIDPEVVFELASYGSMLIKKNKEKEIFDCFLKIRKYIGNKSSSILDSSSSKTLRLELRNNYNLHYSANQIRAIREKIRSKLGSTSLSDYCNMVNIGSLPYPYEVKDETR